VKNNFQKIEKYLIIIPLLFVGIVKIPHLKLPYFWDEAWSYFPAVYKMYENGPGLLPGALPLWDAKGHPLFFFFLSSLWMKIAGTSVFWVHVLPLLISLVTLIAVFILLKKHVNTRAANIAIVLFSIQSLFLAQATMLLPEMLITLLLILSIHTYLNEKYLWFALVASVMVMTKETSIVFVGGFLVFHFITFLKNRKQFRKFFKESILISIPILVYGIFLIIHKKVFGSFFFEDHMGYVQFSFAPVVKKLKIAAGIIFINYGRIVVLLTVVGAIAIILFKRQKLKNKKLLAILVFQTIIFLLFSAFNFYTQRYMLGLLALFMILAGVILEQVKLKNIALNGLVLTIIIAVPLYFTFTKKSSSDSNLGYVEVVKVHQQMVKYCEEQGWHDQPVAASFNLIFCLRNPHLSYVSSDQGFSNVVHLRKFREAEIFLNECTSYGLSTQLDSIKKENKLVKEFRLKHAWGEIYTNFSGE
jgi:hypothetical protein